MTELPGTATRTDLTRALRFLFAFAFPLAVAGCGLLFPLLLMGMQTDYDLGVSFVALFNVAAFAFWPVPLLVCLLFKRGRLRLLLVWWGALCIPGLATRQYMFSASPIRLIPEPLNTQLFLFAGFALLCALILRRVFGRRWG